MSSRSRLILHVAAVIAALAVSVGLVSLQSGVPSQRLGTLLAHAKGKSDSKHVEVRPGQRCTDCHLARHRSSLSGPCQDCHTTGTWRSSAISHETTAMDVGPHARLRCVQCHVKPNSLPDPACKSCHTTIAHRSQSDCRRCHGVTTWRQTSFSPPKQHVRLAEEHRKLRCPDCHDFGAASRPPTSGPTPRLRCLECHAKHPKAFPLKAPHAKRCQTCHKVTAGRDNLNVISAKATECSKCHRVRHKGLPRCGTCHTTAFGGTRYGHGTWPLTGAHKKVACASCHPDSQWKSVKGTTCASCHGVRHSGLTDCARCHTTAGFKRTTFSHSTAYKLAGAHARIACARCHPKADWGVTTGSACADCHAVRHAGYARCAECHGTSSFRPSTFRHDRIWKLSGAHAKVACTRCHAGGRWKVTRGSTCVSCHGARHGGLTACAKCHTTKAFALTTFAHSRKWPLTGAHTAAECTSCHRAGRYAQTKGTACVNCHGVRHGGQRRCETCHTTSAWAPIKAVPHSPKFPLYGQHRYVDCVACHKGSVFTGTPRRCVDCHADVAHGHGGTNGHNGTVDHSKCESCHVPRSWKRILPHDMSACS